MKLWSLRPKYGGLGAQPPAAGGDRGCLQGAEHPVFGNFVVFELKYSILWHI